MKVATLKPFVVDVICPHCEEYVNEPQSDSLMWEITEMERGQVYECNHCGEKFKLPASVKSLAI